MDQHRRLLVETLVVSLTVDPAGDTAALSAAVAATVPRIGACLTRLVRAFIRDKLGSALLLLADYFAAVASDLADLARRGGAASAEAIR